MILNPFKGYSEEKRNILNPELKDTIKEFAQLDGAFVIRGNGAVETAGAFLKADLVKESLPQGWGARHHSAAAITSITKAIAITVSQSTGDVRIFKDGYPVMEIEKPSKT
jgi:DNA integrity scanning protein DisA with diadenylate cyclase activity